MAPRRLGRTGFDLSPIGFGAFKIGRNQQIKYAHEFALPDEREVERLLNGVLDLGITYIDTAPAYGLSEERIGRAIAHRTNEFVLSTKVGETFANGRSSFDFSKRAVRESMARSRARLRVETLDVVFVHSDGNDRRVLMETDAVATLIDLRTRGEISAIGFSGKTVEGARLALDWADAIMVEYHLNDRSHEEVIRAAAAREVGVIIKKPLASGALQPHQAIPFLLANAHVSSIVIGGLNLEHVRENLRIVGE